MNTKIQTMNDNISAMLQKLTDTSSKTDKHEEQLTYISSKPSNYEDHLEKLIIKDTHIQPFSLHITNIIDTSSKSDMHE